MGMICLGVWFVRYGVLGVIPGIPATGLLLSVLGLVTGILLLSGK